LQDDRPDSWPDEESSTQESSMQMDAISPTTAEAQTRLRGNLTQYRMADEATRRQIEEHVSQLADAGVSKPELASTLGAMFAMESSAAVKCSILDELYYIDDPSVFEQVRLGLSPDQPLQVRDEAIYVLRDIGDSRAIQALWPYLSDPDINIREEAQEAIDAIMLRGGATPP
jgi:hypothetical protein